MIRAGAAALLLAAAALPAQAGLPTLCGRSAGLGAAQQDRLLQVAALARGVLERSGARVALIARTGTDLSRLGARYSHAGVALAANPNSPWSVRQLYFDCDSGTPRLYDQGLAGFTLGTDHPQRGFLSLVLLSDAAAAPLEAAALDDARALRLLAARYSANAYPYSLRYQNCNQWVAELLASVGAGDPPPGAAEGAGDARAAAQQRLRETGYVPAEVDIGSRWVAFAAGFVPWVHLDDHPDDERYGLHQQLSLPSSLEAYVRRRWPAARRLELCHDGARVVVREGWTPLDASCTAAAGDEEVALEAPAGPAFGPQAPRSAPVSPPAP